MVRIIISGFKSFDEQITSTRGQYFSRNLVYQAYMQDMEFTSQLPEASGLGNLTRNLPALVIGPFAFVLSHWIHIQISL